ncbi:MAG: VTT domain-containing protein [Clostridia bacterium]|nr:VTT domain-containing protein [Clostridia bacterium]
MKAPEQKYDRLIKILQLASFAFMVAMLIACVVFIIANNISVRNIDAITSHIHGGTLTVSALIIAFTLIKSFALVFPPIILYFVAGVVLGNAPLAIAVNLIASALSLILPYFLGRFTGKEMLSTLENKFKAVKKLEDFTEENTWVVVFVLKVSGIIPSDLSSVIFGAMNIPFGKYFIASNLGLLALNVSWSLIGAKGDLANPLTYLYMLPIVICLVVSLPFILKARKRSRQKSDKAEK